VKSGGIQCVVISNQVLATLKALYDVMEMCQ